MLTINNNRENVEFVVSCKVDRLAAERVSITLRYSTPDPVWAALFAEAMNKELSERLKAIREESYNRGWKDAKARKQKQTFFAWWW